MKLSIPKPCHENWNEMTPTEKGRFCGSCQKEVTDFTNMTKIEIKEFFMNKASESACGRFENRQIEAFNRPEIKPKRINSKPWWIAAATFFLFAKQNYSQTLSQSKHKQIQTDSTKKKAPVAMEAPKPNNMDPGDDVFDTDALSIDSTFKVSGIVLNEHGDSMSFATVLLEGTAIGAMTDTNGRFTFHIPKNHIGMINIKVTYLGYSSLDTTFLNFRKNLDVGVLKFTERQVYTLGGAVFTTGAIVSVSSSLHSPATLFRRLRMKMRNRQ